MKQLLIIFAAGFFMVSCKSTKNNTVATETATEETVDKSLNTSKTEDKQAVALLANSHYSLFHDFNTLEIKADIDYTDKNMNQSPTADIQIQKNKQILITVRALFGVTVAKVYLTPERASYYEITGSHYDGDYAFIEKFLGTIVNYENVENLLLGKAFYNLESNDYTQTKNNELELKLNQFLMRLVFGNKNEIASTEVTQDKSADKLLIQYPSYQLSNNLFLPKEINIHAMQKDQIQIKIDYRRVSVNPSIDFRYKIPNNSKPIKI